MVTDYRAGPVPAQSARAYSVLRADPAYVVLAVAIGCANNFADPDLWMHILTGQRIIRSGHIPLVDLYSYSAAGLAWRNHEWLAQVILAASYNELGIFGLKMLKLLMVAITVVAMATGLSRTAAPIRIQRLVLLATAAGFLGQIQFRPQLFTFALLAVMLAVLAKEVYRGGVRLWPLIPMFAIWANFHGGFLVGLGALGMVSAIIAVQEFIAQGYVVRAWRIAAVTLGCGLATLLNPSGLGLWSNVLHSVSDPVVKGFIGDWLSLPAFLIYNWHTHKFDEIQYLAPLGLFVGFVLSLTAAPDPRDGSLAAVALLFIGLALYSSRNIPLAVISLSVPFAHHLGLAIATRAPQDQDKQTVGPGPIFLIAGALIVAIGSGEFSDRLKTWEPVPSGALAFMKERQLHGNILNELSWGSYLIWHGAPQNRVFIDGRCEIVYPDRLLCEYFAFFYGWPGGERLLDQYPHDLVLVKPGTGADRLVAADPNWKLVYRDSVAVLFARRSSGAANHIREVTNGVAPQASFP